MLSRFAADAQPERHIVERGAPRQQCVILEENPHITTVEIAGDRTGARPLQSDDRTQQAALARSRGTDQTDELPGVDTEIGAFENRLGAIAERQAGYVEHLGPGDREIEHLLGLDLRLDQSGEFEGVRDTIARSGILDTLRRVQ